MSDVLFSKNLLAMSNIRHGFYTSKWGDCGYAKTEAPPESASPNREAVARHLKVKYENLVSCYQVHSSDVVVVNEPWAPQRRPHVDAMVTNVPGIALGILTADCVPVLWVDRGRGVIGACHAGWKGALGGVLENTWQAMEQLGASRKYTHVALGPCIWQSSYEVTESFREPFLKEQISNQSFFSNGARNGHLLFNLPSYVEAKLRNLGVGSVESSPADTAADEEHFFSYRRSTLRQEIRGGSLISVIVLAT